MAGFKLRTNLSPARSLEIAWHAAQDQGYSLDKLDGEKPFRARKGHWLMSLMVGALAPHRHFTFSAQNIDNATSLVLDAHIPWMTTGAEGSRRVRNQAEALLDAVEQAIVASGGQVLERKEF